MLKGCCACLSAVRMSPYVISESSVKSINGLIVFGGRPELFFYVKEECKASVFPSFVS
jgi:hypothetical protein